MGLRTLEIWLLELTTTQGHIRWPLRPLDLQVVEVEGGLTVMVTTQLEEQVVGVHPDSGEDHQDYHQEDQEVVNLRWAHQDFREDHREDLRMDPRMDLRTDLRTGPRMGLRMDLRMDLHMDLRMDHRVYHLARRAEDLAAEVAVEAVRPMDHLATMGQARMLPVAEAMIASLMLWKLLPEVLSSRLR